MVFSGDFENFTSKENINLSNYKKKQIIKNNINKLKIYDNTNKIKSDITIIKNIVEELTKIILSIDNSDENYKKNLKDLFSKKYKKNLINNLMLYTRYSNEIYQVYENLIKIDKNKLNIFKNNFEYVKSKFVQKELISKYDIEPHTAIFMLSEPYNVMYQVLNTKSYFYVYNPITENIMTIGNSLVDLPYQQQYILNISENNQFKTINMLISLTHNDLKLIANIFKFNSYIVQINYKNIKKNFEIQKFSFLNEEINKVSRNFTYTIEFVKKALKKLINEEIYVNKYYDMWDKKYFEELR
jgi:hypothetical protein